MKTFLSSLILISINFQLVAQKKDAEIQIGYFAPYITNIGGSIGFAFELKKWETTSTSNRIKLHRLQLLSQLSYFNHPGVTNNIFFNPEIIYKWRKSNKRFYLASSIGTGYLLSSQRQEGKLNLATGNLDYQNELRNYFAPNINLGFGVDPLKNIGFYFKTLYGRKFTMGADNAAFFGVSLGILIKIKSKN